MNLSIIGQPSTGIERRSREERKQRRQQRRQERKEKRKSKPGAFKKIALAIPRNAFLGLVRLNFRGLATRLMALNSKDPAKFKAVWLRLGGKPEALLSAAGKGATKKRLLGITGPGSIDIDSIGEPATAATLLASAAAIIPVVAKVLKDSGIKADKDENLDNFKAVPGITPDSDTQITDTETPEAKAMQPVEDSNKSTFSFSPTTGLIAAGLIGVLLLSKKK